MTTKVTVTNGEGIPEIVQVDDAEVESRSDLVDLVINALDKRGVPLEEDKVVNKSVWLTTSEGVVRVKKDYGNNAYEVHIKQLSDHDADAVASYIMNNTEGGYSSASQEEVGEAITEEEYTTGVGVSGAPSSGGDIAAEITIYEDGTYDFNNKSGGRNHEGVFSAIVAVQDKKEDVLVPLIITEDGWAPGISGMDRIGDAIKDAFKRSL